MRARNIKPGFFKNESLAEVPPLGRILFEGLWLLADREGRLEDRPRRIWAEVLPYDPYDGNELLWQLHDRGFIIRYNVEGKYYVQIPEFLSHQKPHQNEIESKIPDFSLGCKTCRQGNKSLIPSDNLGVMSPGLLSESLNPSCLNPESLKNPCVGKQAQVRPPLLITAGNRELSQEEKLAAQYAPAIHARHVARKCSLKTARDKLTSILRKTKKSEQLELVEKIDHNHQIYCQSEDWTKEEGQFCPSLEKWLNPKQDRYLVEIDSVRNGPKPKSKLEQQREEAMRDAEKRIG